MTTNQNEPTPLERAIAEEITSGKFAEMIGVRRHIGDEILSVAWDLKEQLKVAKLEVEELKRDKERLDNLQAGNYVICLIKPEMHAIPFKDLKYSTIQPYHFQYNCSDKHGYFDSVRQAIDNAMKEEK